MRIINNLRLGVRLGGAFAIVLALTFCLGIMAVNRIAAVNAATADLATNWLPATRSLGEYRSAINSIRRAEGQHVMSTSDDQFAKAETRIAEQKVLAAKAFRAYASTVTMPDEKRLLEAIHSAEDGYFKAQTGLLKTSRASDGVTDGLRTLYNGESQQALGELMEAISKDVEFQSKGADLAFAASQEHYESTRRLVIGLLAAAVVTGVALALAITRSITVSIRHAVEVAETVARGDLRSQVAATSRDEVGQLMAALKRMNDALVATVSTVRRNADSVATASSQIAQGNIDLSQRTEEQASNLQQTAASMEEMTATVKQNADTARQAAQLATSASGVAGKGGEVVGCVVATMEDISQSSKKIADIIGTIDGIAFQTNILALNAAVEAARAGEQGRGFAVVASEVRSLAQRSANAAKEIKALIGASVEKVEAGTALVGDAGRTMGEIVDQVKRVSDHISEISAASVEQTSGIGQIGDAVTQLDQVTQQNAALVEESAAAAESLKVQAGQLAHAVSFFTLEERAASLPASDRTPGKMPVAEAPPGRTVASPPPKHRIGEPRRASAGGKAASAVQQDEWESF